MKICQKDKIKKKHIYHLIYYLRNLLNMSQMIKKIKVKSKKHI